MPSRPRRRYAVLAVIVATGAGIMGFLVFADDRYQTLAHISIVFRCDEAVIADAIPRQVDQAQAAQVYTLTPSLNFAPIAGSPPMWGTDSPLSHIPLPAQRPVIDVYGIGGDTLTWRHTGPGNGTDTTGSHTGWLTLRTKPGIALVNVRAALDLAGVHDRERILRQNSGDGILLVLPPGVEDLRVFAMLGQFARQVAAQDGPAGDRLRLRVAVTSGAVLTAEMGFAGSVVVEVSRLRDAQPLRVAMAARPQAHVGLILSDTFYQDLAGRANTADFTPVDVAERNYQSRAWISVIAEHP